MRKLQKFCPKCGKTTNDLIEGFCEECYIGTKALLEVPQRIDVVKCPNCGLVYIKGDWIKTEMPVEDSITSAVKLKGQAKISIALESRKAVVTAEGLVHEDQKSSKIEKHAVELRERKRMCENCSRARGGYYQAVIQVRSEDVHKIKRVMTMIQELLERPRGKLWFIAKTVEVKNGFDVYLGSKVMLTTFRKRLAAEMNAEMKVSHELYGQIDSREVYRDILLVRV